MKRMAALAALVCCLPAGACGGYSLRAPSSNAVAAPVTQPTDEYVGTTRWTAGKKPICDRPEDYQTPRPQCFSYEGKITVVRLVTGKYGVSSGYEVQTTDGRTGYIGSYLYSTTHSDDTHKKKLAEKADCDRRGGVQVGMTREQVYATCWGKPQKINKTIGSYGTHEQLVYGSQYLYLENGVLRSIQTSE